MKDKTDNIPVYHKPTLTELEENQKKRERDGYAPNPECKVCHGIGYLYPRTSDNKIDYSRVIRCYGPDCLAASFEHWKETGEYLELKGVSSRLQTFEQFKIMAGTATTFKTFKSLADGSTNKVFLLCCGGVGCGKTHLCQATTAKLNQRGINAYYYRAPDLVNALRASVETHDTDEWLRGLRECGALIIDDYGLQEDKTGWTTAQLEDVVDARWQEKRITVMVTNLTVDQLPPRMKSRFLDREISTYIVNEGADYRKVKR